MLSAKFLTNFLSAGKSGCSRIGTCKNRRPQRRVCRGSGYVQFLDVLAANLDLAFVPTCGGEIEASSDLSARSRRTAEGLLDNRIAISG